MKRTGGKAPVERGCVCKQVIKSSALLRKFFSLNTCKNSEWKEHTLDQLDCSKSVVLLMTGSIAGDASLSDAPLHVSFCWAA